MPMNEIILNLSEWAGVIAVTLILSLSRRLAVRPVAFKYQSRETAYALGLSVVLLAASAYASLVMKIPTLAPVAKAGLEPRQLAWAAAILVPVVLLLLVRRQPLLSVGLSQRSLKPGLLLGAALALITIFLRGKVYSLLDGINAAEFNALLASLALGLAGEIVFRGYIQLRLAGWLGPNGGWLLTSAIHFLFCLPGLWLLSGGHLATLWPIALVQLGQSFLLGWVMRKSGSALACGLYQSVHLWTLVL